MDRDKLYFPMLAKSKDEIFDDPNWLFEPKFDGIRCIAYVTKDKTTLVNRGMNDITSRFPEIHICLSGIDSAVIDGELCCFTGEINSPPYFQYMQTRMHRIKDIEIYSNKYPSTFVGFDILEINNTYIGDCPLSDRKNALQLCMKIILNPNSDTNQFSSYPVNGLIGKGQEMMKQLIGWEGVMAKRLDSKYTPGYRSSNWLKIKPRKFMSVSVLGLHRGVGKRSEGIGALIIGIKSPSNRFYTPLGNVGTGFTDEEQVTLLRKIIPATKRYLPPWEFVGQACEPFPIIVSYIEKTNDGRLRHPSYEGCE